MWPVIEFVIYISLLLVLLIMMITKLSSNFRQSNVCTYEKKLDILHKKFLQSNSRKKKSQVNKIKSQSSQVNENLQNLANQAVQRRDTRGSIIGGIGNFKTNDDQLQNVDLDNIKRLVQLNGEGFKQSDIKDLKLYQRIREKQLEEYQNIVINRRFQDIKAIQYSKWKLTWYMVKLQLKRKNIILNLFSSDNKLGYFHKLGGIFVYILEMLVILTVCQSIRRTFYFSWYNLNSDVEDNNIKTLIIGICILAQFVVTSPLFLLVQIWIDQINSEFSEVKKKIQKQQQSKHCLCVIMSDQGSANAIITSIIFIIGVYQGICLNAELNYKNIDFSIFVTWIGLCVAELFFFRNFYIIIYAILKFSIAKDRSLKEDIRMTLFLYYVIDMTKRKGKRPRTATASRRSILKKIQSQRKINNNDDLFESIQNQSQQNEEEKISTKEGNGDKNEQLGKQKSNEIGKKNPTDKKIKTIQEDNNEYDNSEEEEDDLSDDSMEDEYISEEQNQQNGKPKSNQNNKQPEQNVKEIKNEIKHDIENNILPQSILNNIRNTNSIDTCNKGDSNNDCQQQHYQEAEINGNHQVIKHLTADIMDNSPITDNNGKRLNTSFAFNDESVIQDEQPVTLETIVDQKLPKNKKNFTYSRILSQTLEGQINQISHIYSPNFGYKQVSSVIKTFTTGEYQDDESSDNIREHISETSIGNVDQNNQKSLVSPKKQVNFNPNDKSLTINREIAIGKVHNLEIMRIMTLQEQKKFENDTSFLKNLAELKQIKNDDHTPGNKTPNDVSLFGNKDISSFLNNEDQLFNNNNNNNNQKNLNASMSYILNKSELLEILKQNTITPYQNA